MILFITFRLFSALTHELTIQILKPVQLLLTPSDSTFDTHIYSLAVTVHLTFPNSFITYSPCDASAFIVSTLADTTTPVTAYTSNNLCTVFTVELALQLHPDLTFKLK